MVFHDVFFSVGGHASWGQRRIAQDSTWEAELPLSPFLQTTLRVFLYNTASSVVRSDCVAGLWPLRGK